MQCSWLMNVLFEQRCHVLAVRTSTARPYCGIPVHIQLCLYQDCGRLKQPLASYLPQPPHCSVRHTASILFPAFPAFPAHLQHSAHTPFHVPCLCACFVAPQMLLAVTRPRLPKRRGVITVTPLVPTELLPPWASLGLRMTLGAAAKTLAAAQAEPPGLLPLLVGLQELGRRLWYGKQGGHTWGGFGYWGWCCGGHEGWHAGGPVMHCVRCRWPAVLRVLGQLVDRLASLEAVVGDVASHLLADPASAALMQHEGAAAGQLEATVRRAVGAAGRVLRVLAEQLERNSGGGKVRVLPGAGPSMRGVGLEVGCKAAGAASREGSKHSGRGDPSVHKGTGAGTTHGSNSGVQGSNPNGDTAGGGSAAGTGGRGIDLSEVKVVDGEEVLVPSRTVAEEAAALQEAVVAASRAYWGRIIGWKRRHITGPMLSSGASGGAGPSASGVLGHTPSARALVPQAMPIRLLRGRQVRGSGVVDWGLWLFCLA